MISFLNVVACDQDLLCWSLDTIALLMVGQLGLARICQNFQAPSACI